MKDKSVSTRLNLISFLVVLAIAIGPTQLALAQLTTSITYQGKLNDNGSPASGQYDFQFKLFDTATVGTGVQQGGPVTVSNVTVTAGILTVQLDFGAGVFPAAGNRFLEIAVKQTSGSSFTTLSPRQPVTANPYAIRSLNSTTADGLSVSCVNCITSSQIQSVQGSQVTGNVAGGQINGLIPVASVPAGSANYIQNRTSQQASANFNISGDGTAGGNLTADIVRANTQINIGVSRVLSTEGANNVFVGPGTGTNINTGSGNSFLGQDAGNANTAGSSNTFIGRWAGFSNVIAGSNTFVGFSAGKSNTAGGNSFFGASAGSSNTTGFSNSYFGAEAGQEGISVYMNSFFGYRAGKNGGGAGNSYFGAQAGELSGNSGNSFFGESSGQNNSGGGNSFFGASAGTLNNSGYENVFIGYTAGGRNTSGFQNTFVGNSAGVNTTTDIGNTIGDDNTLIGAGANVGSGNLIYATAIGAYATVSSSNTIALGRADGSDTVLVPGKLQIDTLATAGATALCLNSSNRVGTCSSSLRYKTNLEPFASGLSIINRLHPITFTWKEGGRRDVGLGAEDVAKVEPLLTFTNSKGEIEGVKYNQLSAVFINAFKEQQEQIEERVRQAAIQQQQIEQYRKQLAQQQQQMRRQQEELANLKRIVCLSQPKTEACKARSHTR